MSSDSFHYFRTWIVGVGKRAFETAKRDPDALGQFLDGDEESIDVDNESLEYVALEVLRKRGIGVDPRERSASSADDEPAGVAFDLQTLGVDYPRLSALCLRSPSPRDDSHSETSDRRSETPVKMTVPLIEGRAASEADVKSGKAIFCIEQGRSMPYSFGRKLPLIAEIVNKNLGEDFPVGRQVTIVQAEIADGKHVTLGIVDQNERKVCALEDVNLLE